MNRLLGRLQHRLSVISATTMRLLSPEIILADLRQARKQIAVPVWRKRSSPLERIIRAWNLLPGSVHQGCAMTLVMLLLSFAVCIPKTAYEISISNDETGSNEILGVMHDSTSLSLWIEEIIADEAGDGQYDYDLFIYPSVSVQPVWWSGSYTNSAVIKSKLRASVEVLAEASIIRVSDKITLPVVNAQAANQVLDNVQLHYLESKNVNTLKANFNEEVYVERQRIEPQRIISIEEATEILLQGSEERRMLTIQPGDNLWDLAMAMASERPGMDVDEAMQQLSESNPQLQTLGLQPGDTLYLPGEREPLLGVTITETVEEREEIPFGTEYRYSDEMYRDEELIEREGVPGVRVVQYAVTRTNGNVVGRVKLKEIFDESSGAKAPINSIIMRGTKYREYRGTENFIWPISGHLTDRFGWRDLGYHKGQDISSGGVATVVAADSGIVTQAGWDNGGLGYSVTIDHRNGYVTRYGHFSQVLVSVGEGVNQGDPVGIEGNSGYSFGTHLHFEVIVNGAYDDPLKYLP